MKPACYKPIIVEAIGFLFILLFVYAAVSKILDFENFQAQVGQSPFLSPLAGIISYAVLIVELLVAVCIAIPVTRLVGLYAATVLMALFTAYIIIILNFSSFIPCSCGGVLEKMTWTTHLLFNVAFVLLGIVAVLLKSSNLKRPSLILSAAILTSVASITVAFILTEDIMAKENPFIRRFPQASAAKIASVDLKLNATYVAGVANGKVYIGNLKAPLEILEYDTNLKNRARYNITLDKEDYNFQAVEVQIHFPYFYLYDGNVPVIYRGLVSDWKASVISEKEYAFTDIVFTESGKQIIRTRYPKTGENTLATVTNNDIASIKYYPALLEKQTDGIFDTDGTLQYSQEYGKAIYTYFYRNQYIITDENLELDSRNNTIDTTSKARIKVVTLSQSGNMKLAAPPYTVNKRTTVYHNLLFVNSMLRGKFEDARVWHDATAVDVYDFVEHIYLLSFYVYYEDYGKMQDFFATDNAIYMISGHHLLKYGYGEKMTSKLKNNIPAGSRTADRKPVKKSRSH